VERAAPGDGRRARPGRRLAGRTGAVMSGGRSEAKMSAPRAAAADRNPKCNHDGLIAFAVFGLVVMAAWTLVIKYLAPILYVVSERAAGRSPGPAPVMWDFWWVAHLALAWLLWRRHAWARAAGMAIAAAEIAVVTVKFIAYMRRPDLSFWRLLWFTNKVYVLAFFVVLLIVFLRRKGWPAPAADPGPAPGALSAGARS